MNISSPKLRIRPRTIRGLAALLLTLLAAACAMTATDGKNEPESTQTVQQAALGEALNLNQSQWWWFTDKSPSDLTTMLSNNGARLVSLQVSSTSPLLFTGAMVQNFELNAKSWWWFFNEPASAIPGLLQQNNARLISLSPYVVNGALQFAVVMISDTGADAKGWWWYYNETQSNITTLLQQNNARLVDLRQYTLNGTTYYAVIMLQNTGVDETGSWWYVNVPRTSIPGLLQQNNAFLISIDSADTTGSNYNVVMNSAVQNMYWWWYPALDTCQLSAATSHGLSRIIDLKAYQANGLERFAVIFVSDTPAASTSDDSAKCAELTISNNGQTLAAATIPTNNAYAYSTQDGDLNGAAFGDLSFTAGSFPPGQTVIAYNFSYGFGPDDPGGLNTPTDVVAGHWPCIPTKWVALSANAGQTVTAPQVTTGQVTRYVEGTCRVQIPWGPVLLNAEVSAVQQIQAQLPVPSLTNVDLFEVTQPQFRGQGSNIQAGLMFEGEYFFSIIGVALAGSPTVSVDPAFSFGVSSNGLMSTTILNQNIVTDPNVPSSDVNKITASIVGQSASIGTLVSNALTIPVSQMMSSLGVPSGVVSTSCTTQTAGAASTECFNKIQASLNSLGTMVPLAQLAANALQAKNFTCDSMNQCDFHPILQAVNVLPTSLEFVVAPDLSNSTGDALTPFYQALPASATSKTVPLGNPDAGNATTLNVALSCAAVPSGVTSGDVTTVYLGNPDDGSGIQCGSIANFVP